MRGPAGAFVLACIQMVCGTHVYLYYTSVRWRILNRGYFRSTLWVLWPLMIATAFLLPGESRVLGIGVGAAFALHLAAVYSQRPLLEWTLGGLAALAAAAIFLLPDDPLQAAAGGLLLGAATHGMTLGHWYLNQARLPIDPLRGAIRILFGALTIAFAVGVVQRDTLTTGPVPSGVLMFSGSSYWWVWAALLVGTGVLAYMVDAAARIRATQSATGLLYIAIVTALAAQLVMNLLALT